MAGPVVDTLSATEFMSEALNSVSEHDLVVVAGECAAKAQRMRAVLGDGRAGQATPDDLRRVLRSVFGTRRRASAILDALGAEVVRSAIDDLLHTPDPLANRFERFDQAFSDFAEPTYDLPAELLHFTYPEQYWLWTRWIWDPRIDTGALRLVTMEEFDLTGATRAETYMRVGEGIAFVSQTGEAAGFTAYGRGPFGIDVFLACVYAVYMYTVLRMRMTQEFNQIVPELPELVRRLLGVHRLEV